MIKNILLSFTRSLSAGLSMARITVRKMLPNLYLINRSRSNLPLVYEGDYPYQFPHAYGEYLDKLGDMFGVRRLYGEGDESYRIRILFTIRQNSTKNGIKETVELLFASAMFEVEVDVVESVVDVFDGISTSFDTPVRDSKGSMLYGVSIIVTPKTERMTSVTFMGTTYELTTGSYFHRVRAGYFKYLMDVFQANSFHTMISRAVASGVKVIRVTFVEPGAGGNKHVRRYHT